VPCESCPVFDADRHFGTQEHNVATVTPAQSLSVNPAPAPDNRDSSLAAT